MQNSVSACMTALPVRCLALCVEAAHLSAGCLLGLCQDVCQRAA